MSSRNYYHATEALARDLGIRLDSRDGIRISEGWQSHETPLDVARAIAIRHELSGADFGARLTRLMSLPAASVRVRLALMLSEMPQMPKRA